MSQGKITKGMFRRLGQRKGFCLRGWAIGFSAVMVVLCVGFVSILGSAFAEEGKSPAEFYKGKRIRHIVASREGSGTDLITRALAPYIEKKTGAKVKIDYMKAAGGLQGLNYAFVKGSRDGLTLVTKPSSVVWSNDVLGASGVRYKADQFNWLIGLNPARLVFGVNAKTPYKSLKDLQKAKGLKIGAASAKGTLTVLGITIVDMAKLDAKVITGFKGSSGTILAVIKGEVAGAVMTEYLMKKQVETGNMRVLFSIWGKSSVFPNAPLLPDLIKPSREQEIVLRQFGTLTLSVMTTPGVPRARVAYLRKILQEIARDKGAQKAIHEAIGMPSFTGFISGEELQKSMATKGEGIKEAIEALRRWMEKYRA